MSSFAGGDEGDTLYAEDVFAEGQQVPPKGVRLELELSRNGLNSQIELPDSASWTVEELEVTQVFTS